MLLLQLHSIFIFFDKIYPILKIYLYEKTCKTQKNVLPNYFYKLAVESGLLGPKIALWHFFIFLKFKLKEGDFLWQTSWISFCSKYYQKFIAKELKSVPWWNEVENHKLKTFTFKWGVAFGVVLLYHCILFKIGKSCFF